MSEKYLCGPPGLIEWLNKHMWSFNNDFTNKKEHKIPILFYFFNIKFIKRK